jgi:hypothetical protein
MRKTLIAALVVSAGLVSQVVAQNIYEKEQILNFSLSDTYQSLVTVNGVYATNTSFGLVCNCIGNGKYVSATKKITTQTILTDIAKALGRQVFSSKAQLVIYTPYCCYVDLPPYPPFCCDAYFCGYGVEGGGACAENWPDNERKFRWWNAQFIVKDWDAAGKNVILCTNVTPFFVIDESYCLFCWDTWDRVTDGYINNNTTVDPCITSGCDKKGSGVTRYYLTIRFNNTYRNTRLQAWLENDYPISHPNGSWIGTADRSYTLDFVLNGIVTYNWTFKNLNTGANLTPAVPMGTHNMPATGYGYSPFCGHYLGTVTITEKATLVEQICDPSIYFLLLRQCGFALTNE